MAFNLTGLFQDLPAMLRVEIPSYLVEKQHLHFVIVNEPGQSRLLDRPLFPLSCIACNVIGPNGPDFYCLFFNLHA